MSEDKLTIFHIYRKNGISTFLYPFSKQNSIVELLDSKEVVGLYGKEPRVESLTLLRNDFYRLIEQGVKDWIAERRFIPRFLISALIFLLLYFVMSVVIRDPIPMIDELLIGLVGAFLMYMFLTKRASDSKTATEMKVRLRTKIDEIVFNEDPFIKDAEEYLQHCEDAGDLEELLLNMMKDHNEMLFSSSDKMMVQQFLDCIQLLYNEKEIKKNEKLLNRMASDRSDEADQRQLLKWMSSRKVDPFLFAVYTRVKKEKSKSA